MAKNRFVTLFPPCNNNELVKDVGMVAYIMAKYYKYDSTVVGSNIDLNGIYADEFKKVLTLCPLKKYFKNDNYNGLMYILKHAKEIDVLHIFHFQPKRNAVWIWIYKLLNPKGVVYLKLDMIMSHMEELKKNKKCTFKIMKIINVISAESEVIKKGIEDIYHRDVVLIPNGYYDFCDIKKVELEHKENLLITVGRLGTYQKATDILLEAFYKSSDRHSWKLRLLGSIEPSFEAYIKSFFEKYPEMKERIEFAGIITDRELLNDEYQKAKVLVLPSRYEGFPLVIPEAMKNGCYMILTSNIPPATELTADGAFGLIVKPDNVSELADAIVKVCTENKNWNSVAQDIINEAAKNYEWIEICGRLDKELQKHLK